MASDDFDPDQAVADAIARGISAEEQYARLSDALRRCNAHLDKIKGIVPKLEAQMVCTRIMHAAAAILDNAQDIDNALFDEGIPVDTPHSTAPSASDSRYDRTYWLYVDKSSADLEAAYDRVVAQPMDSPNRKADASALFDLLRGRGYNPPILAWPPIAPIPHPRPHDDEPVDLGDGARLEERAMPDTGRSAAAMPILDYWLVDGRRGTTLHVVEDCPACPRPLDVGRLDAPADAEALAADLGAHFCGTCRRMLEASAKEGFLFGRTTARETLVVWRDRIEHEHSGLLGFGASSRVIPTEELKAVSLPGLTRLELRSSGDETIGLSLDSEAEGMLAREAFRRLGWSFEDRAQIGLRALRRVTAPLRRHESASRR